MTFQWNPAYHEQTAYAHDRDRGLRGILTVTGGHMSRAAQKLQGLVIQEWKSDFSIQNSNKFISPFLEFKENKEVLSSNALNDTN